MLETMLTFRGRAYVEERGGVNLELLLYLHIDLLGCIPAPTPASTAFQRSLSHGALNTVGKTDKNVVFPVYLLRLYRTKTGMRGLRERNLARGHGSEVLARCPAWQGACELWKSTCDGKKNKTHLARQEDQELEVRQAVQERGLLRLLLLAVLGVLLGGLDRAEEGFLQVRQGGCRFRRSV